MQTMDTNIYELHPMYATSWKVCYIFVYTRTMEFQELLQQSINKRSRLCVQAQGFVFDDYK